MPQPNTQNVTATAAIPDRCFSSAETLLSSYGMKSQRDNSENRPIGDRARPSLPRLARP